jgi:hypothetical protein
MFKRFASLALVATLICTLGGTAAFAQTLPQPDARSNSVNELPDSGFAGRKEAQSSEVLKANILKLVADAKAGKRLVVLDPQNQPRQSNSLSKTTKIALVVGVAVVVILIIVIVHAKNHLFDDFRLGN